MQLHLQLARESQINYEREVMNHATDVSALQAARASIAELEDKVKELQRESEALRGSISEKEASWNEQKQLLENEISESKARYYYFALLLTLQN